MLNNPFQNLSQGWEVKTLGEVCEINPKNKLDDDLEVSFIPMNLIADKYQNKFSYEIRKWSEVKKGYTHLQNHCIAIAKITPCFENGKCVILQDLKNGYGAGTTELIVVLADENKILPKFVFYFFNTTNFTKEGVKNFKGTAGQLRISKDFIANLQIPLPPLEVQKAIVEKLENAFAHIDEAVRHLKVVQTNIPRLKSSLLHCAFSGKLTESQNQSNEVQTLKSIVGVEGEFEREEGETSPFKPLHPLIKEEIPQGWEVKTLGEIFLIERGGSPRPIKEYLTNDESGINWIKIGDTKDISKYIFTTAQKIKLEGKKYSRFVKVGDLILSNSMSFGKPYIMKTTGCIHDGWVVLRQSKKVIDEEFAYYILISNEIYTQFNSLATGSTVKNLNIDRIKQIEIPLPPLETQKQIVQILESKFAHLEKLAQFVNESLENLQRLKSSLLNQAFKGELV